MEENRERASTLKAVVSPAPKIRPAVGLEAITGMIRINVFLGGLGFDHPLCWNQSLMSCCTKAVSSRVVSVERMGDVTNTVSCAARQAGNNSMAQAYQKTPCADLSLEIKPG